jgi:CspA family cold shock protein
MCNLIMVPFFILTKPQERIRLKSKKEYHMAKGTIARLMDRGFGFIKTEDGTDLFFHRNDLDGVEFNSLSQGQEVEFEKSQGRDGRSAAVKVKLVGTEDSQDEAGVEEESETSKEEPEAGIAEEPEK